MTITDDEDRDALNELSRDALLDECVRRSHVAKKLWAGILTLFGNEGLKKMMAHTISFRGVQSGRMSYEDVNLSNGPKHDRS